MIVIYYSNSKHSPFSTQSSTAVPKVILNQYLQSHGLVFKKLANYSQNATIFFPYSFLNAIKNSWILTSMLLDYEFLKCSKGCFFQKSSCLRNFHNPIFFLMPTISHFSLWILWEISSINFSIFYHKKNNLMHFSFLIIMKWYSIHVGIIKQYFFVQCK